MKLKTVTIASDMGLASVLRGLLESAGIPVLLRSDNVSSAAWGAPGYLGGLGAVEVLVPERFLAEAKRVIAEAEIEAAASTNGHRE